MDEPFLRVLRVGESSRMMRPEMQLVTAVSSLNVDGFDVLVKIQVSFAVFSVL